jgi:hypothetical protein
MSRYLEYHKDFDFDSEISPPMPSLGLDNFGITLIMRVYLKKMDPPPGKAVYHMEDADGMKWPVGRWTRAAWDRWTLEYLVQVHETWDEAFTLVPPNAYDGFLWPQSKPVRRNVSCRLYLTLVNNRDEAHATIGVYNVLTSGGEGFRSNSYGYGSQDIKPVKSGGSGATWEYKTMPHEVGHLLGLPHVNQGDPACRAAPGSGICYGKDLKQKMNVMGHGGTLSLDNAKPWIERIARKHTRTDPASWKAQFASWEVQLRGREKFQQEDAKTKSAGS